MPATRITGLGKAHGCGILPHTVARGLGSPALAQRVAVAVDNLDQGRPSVSIRTATAER